MEFRKSIGLAGIVATLISLVSSLASGAEIDHSVDIRPIDHSVSVDPDPFLEANILDKPEFTFGSFETTKSLVADPCLIDGT